MALRIKFISQYYYPEPFSNRDKLNELVARGHQASVLTAVPNYGKENFFEGYSNRKRREEMIDGVAVQRVFTVARGRRKRQLVLNFLTFPVTAGWAAWRERFKRFDVIFCSQLSPVFMMFPAIVAARRHKAPLVVWVQDLWPESAVHILGIHNRFVVRILDMICGLLYRRADMLLVQSHAFKSHLARFGIAKEKMRFFPNSAASFYRPLRSDEALAKLELLKPARFRVLFAGNIGEAQDLSTLVSAAEQLRDRQGLMFTILGSGRGADVLQAKIASRGLDAMFEMPGRFPEQDMPEFFAHADALYLGLQDNDVFALTVPLKLQSYIACGKPVVASMNGEGSRILMEAEAGIAVPASKPKELAAAIARLIDMTPEARAKLGRSGRAYFERHYHHDKVSKILETALQDAVAANRE